MQLNFVNQNEFSQNIIQEQKTKKMFSIAVGCSMLMLGLLLLEYLFMHNLFDVISYIVGFFMSLVSDIAYKDACNSVYSYLANETYSYIFAIIISTLTLFLPFLLLAKKAGLKVSDGFRVKLDIPKKLWLYIPFTVGAGFAVNFIVALLFGGLFKRFYEGSSDLPTTTIGIILSFVLIAFIPAIFEEWAFRGILLRSLMPHGKVFALIVSSVIFGSMHVSPPRILFATSFGLLAGFIYMKTGSIWYGSMIHLVNNALSVATSYAVGYKGQYSSESVFFGLIVILLILSAVGGFIYFLCTGYFKTHITHHNTPPEKPKLLKSQYFKLSLLNCTTVAFVCLYLLTLAYEFYIKFE